MIINFPEEVPKVGLFRYRLISNVWQSSSDFNGAIQTYQQPGSRWEFTLGWQILTASEAGIVSAFIAELDGMANRVMLYDMANPEPAGNMRGAPVVNGANQTGKTLTISNVTPGHNLKRGDNIGINCTNHQMIVKITRDVIADAAGNMTIDFAPALPSPAINGSLVEWDRPKAKFVMMGEAPSLNAISGRQITDVNLVFVQDITA